MSERVNLLTVRTRRTGRLSSSILNLANGDDKCVAAAATTMVTPIHPRNAVKNEGQAEHLRFAEESGRQTEERVDEPRLNDDRLEPLPP